MAKTYGTNILLDTLGVKDASNVFLDDYGIDDIFAAMTQIRDIHNEMTADFFGSFMGRTTDKIARLGVDSVEGEMVEVNEDGLADVQKVAVTGYDIGFPLRLFQYGRQWTERWLAHATLQEVAAQFVAAQTADVKKLRRLAMEALFGPANYTWTDYLDRYQDLPVKRLINADSSPIPRDQYGNTFNGATHTHYLGTASLVASDIQAAINTVVEHGVNGGELVIYINKAQEAAIRAMTSNFEPLLYPLTNPGPGATDNQLNTTERFNPYLIDDRVIGAWDGWIWVETKPWVPANYMVFLIEGGANEPILMMREDTIAQFRGWRMIVDREEHPLAVQHFERSFGVGVWNRFGAAILRTNNATYAAPTFTG